MTPRQEQHLQAITMYFAQALEKKYRKGAKEHKGNLLSLTPKELLEEAINENIDQFVYLITALQKLD